jgi:hypothetical protein
MLVVIVTQAAYPSQTVVEKTGIALGITLTLTDVPAGTKPFDGEREKWLFDTLPVQVKSVLLELVIVIVLGRAVVPHGT